MLFKSGKVKFLSANENEFEADGQKQKYYDLAIMNEGKAFNIKCSKLAYDDAVKIGGFKDVFCIAEYSPERKSVRVVQVVLAN